MNDFIAKRDEKFWKEITQIIEQEELDFIRQMYGIAAQQAAAGV